MMRLVDEGNVRELAVRAGTDEDQVRRLVRLGIVREPEPGGSFGPGDVKRVRLAMACDAAGLPLEAIGRAIDGGELSFAFLDLPSFRWAGRLDQTYAEVAARAGVSVDLLLSMQEALGLVAPSPDAPAREDDLELVPLLQMALGVGIDQSTLLSALCVYGESLRRITAVETAIYHTHIEMPLLRSGLEEREMMERASQVGSQFVPLMDRALSTVYRRQQEHTWTEDLIEHIEGALEEAGLHSGPAIPPAMCFLDLTGYTQLTEERGDRAAAELAGQLAVLVQHVSQQHGGRPVKWLGDGVMFHFREPPSGVRAALEMVERTSEVGLPPAHVGLDAGPIVFQEGDYFGRTVNLAARIASHAGPGQVLVSDRVVEVSDDDLRFRRIGPVELRGLQRPIVLHEAVTTA
jgi:adenylate cyclase